MKIRPAFWNKSIGQQPLFELDCHFFSRVFASYISKNGFHALRDIQQDRKNKKTGQKTKIKNKKRRKKQYTGTYPP